MEYLTTVICPKCGEKNTFKIRSPRDRGVCKCGCRLNTYYISEVPSVEETNFDEKESISDFRNSTIYGISLVLSILAILSLFLYFGLPQLWNFIKWVFDDGDRVFIAIVIIVGPLYWVGLYFVDIDKELSDGLTLPYNLISSVAVICGLFAFFKSCG